MGETQGVVLDVVYGLSVGQVVGLPEGPRVGLVQGPVEPLLARVEHLLVHLSALGEHEGTGHFQNTVVLLLLH